MPKPIALDEVRRLLEEGAQLVDVLSRKEYEDSHLPGAVNLPLAELDERAAAVLDGDRPIVAYCFDYE